VRACHGKREFESRRQAEDFLRRMHNYVMRVYQCQYCLLWHIGHLR